MGPFLYVLFACAFGISLHHVLRGPWRAPLVCLLLAAAGIVFCLASEHGLLERIGTAGLPILILLAFSFLYKRSLSRSLAMAPSIRAFGLANFGRLDVDGDGMISRVDLMLLRDNQDLSDADKQMLRQMSWDVPLIGHVVDTYTSVSAMTGSVLVVSEHGISREDLESYPSRIKNEFELEFGVQ